MALQPASSSRSCAATRDLADFVLAMERGEVDLVSSAPGISWRATHRDEIAKGNFIPVHPGRPQAQPELGHAPLMQELVEDAKVKQVPGIRLGRRVHRPSADRAARRSGRSARRPCAARSTRWCRIGTSSPPPRSAGPSSIRTGGAEVQAFIKPIFDAPKEIVEIAKKAVD